jgi:hypothetical protein
VARNPIFAIDTRQCGEITAVFGIRPEWEINASGIDRRMNLLFSDEAWEEYV